MVKLLLNKTIPCQLEMRGITTMDEKILIKFVSSFVLGDGALSSLKSYFRTDTNGIERPSLNNKIKNSKYYFKQISVHQDYVSFQKEIIENITSVKIYTAPAYVDKRGYHCKEQLNLTSQCHPFFTKIRERMYFEGKKQIDPHYLKNYDLQTFAFFYMDNGWIENTIQKSGAIYTRVGLATHAYSYGDVLLLKNFLKEKFDFNFDIRRHKQKSGEYKFYLRNSKDNSKRFLNSIYDYIFPSYEYKFSTERLTPVLERDDDIV
jgi:hypothetical protein